MMKNQMLLLIVAGSAAVGAAAGYVATIPASRENASRLQQILSELERQKSAAESDKIPRTAFKVNFTGGNHDPAQKGSEADPSKPSAADFLDHTKTYRDKEIAFYMVPDAAYLRNMSLRDILKSSPRYPMIFHLDGYKVAGRIALEFPADLDVPSTAMDERVLVRFRCTQGQIESGNIVVSVDRIEK